MTLNANRSTTVNAGGGTVDVATGTNLTFNASLTGAGTFTKAGAGTFTVGSNNIDLTGEFALSAGTLALNGFDFNVGTLHITGDSVIDFGNSSASFLTAANLIIDAGVSLTINNWVNVVDYFNVTNNPGGSQGNPPLNQITFTGGSYTNNDTHWNPYDHQITPAPEPATYGAILAGFSTLLLAWRRRRSVI
jgi:fibronectin-binding autotransporter adhesin